MFQIFLFVQLLRFFMFKSVLTVAVASVLSFNVFAEFVGPGSTATKTITVKEAIELAEDSQVVLEGNLIKQTEKEHYLFQDKSGEVMVEIDKEDFRKTTVTPNDTIKISGEVDKDWTETKIDVDHLELVK